jgi:hypothetical protein
MLRAGNAQVYKIPLFTPFGGLGTCLRFVNQAIDMLARDAHEISRLLNGEKGCHRGST